MRQETLSPRIVEAEMDTDSAALVLEMIHAVERRDGERLLAIYSPDVEFTWPPELPYGGTYRGNEVIAMSEVFAAAWEPLQRSDRARRFDPRVLGVNGDEVAVLYHQRADTPNGGLWETEVIGLYTVVDGCVARLQMFYFDPKTTAAFLAEAAATAELAHGPAS